MEHPNKDVARFSGSMEIAHIDTDGQKHDSLIGKRIPIHVDSILLRGVVVRNTEWVIGVVLNTGHDTKIIMSTALRPNKESKLGYRTSKEVLFVASFLIFLSLVGALIFLAVHIQVLDDHLTYLQRLSFDDNVSIHELASFADTRGSRPSLRPSSSSFSTFCYMQT